MSARARRLRRSVDDLDRDAQREIKAALIPKRRRFQVVLLWRDWGFFLRGDWPDPRLPIFRWVARVGPIEIRRFAA